LVGTAGLLLMVAAAALDANVRVGVDWSGFALLATILLTLGAELPRRERQGSLMNWALTLTGATYIGWTFAHFVLLRAIGTPPLARAPLSFLRLEPGAAWIVFVLAINFLSDTGAYFVGRTLGRHRLAPYISPKKSMEGAAGGLIAAILAAALLVPLLGLPIEPLIGGLLGAIGSVAGQVGDLAESLIKRQVDTKDSGDLIPGHGGMLDRVDSLLFAAPVMYYLILLATWNP
jgi:phosphatidate cytidylyltransferase